MARNTTGLKRGGPGRTKGVPNRATTLARDLCTRLIEDKVYLRKLRADFRKRKVPPGVEQMIWHYAAGKPKESIELTGKEGAPLKVVFGGRYRPGGASQ